VTSITFEQFSPRLNETFEVAVGEAREPLTLTEAALIQQYDHPGKARDSFSLVFRSASQTVLPQATYALENADMGQVSVFLVPVGRDKDGVSYQAIFN
jgi:hypothetical protein